MQRGVASSRQRTGCQVTPSRREERRARGEHRISLPQPSPPGIPPRSDTTCGAASVRELVGKGAEGWCGEGRAGHGQALGREGTKELSAPDRSRACCTSGIWDSPSAPSSLPLGPRVWTWRQIRILPGEWMASRQPPR